MSLIRATFILTSLSLVSACSLFQAKSEQITSSFPVNWTETESKLRQLENWSISGKIGYRTNSEGGSAAINDWRQDGEFYRVELSSTFLGLGSVIISGGSEFVSIIEQDEEPLISDQPDQILEEALGFPLPTRYLPIWIKGLAESTSDFGMVFGEDDLPDTLEQHGWQIQYSKYAGVEEYLLPHKVVLRRGEVKLTLAIKEWIIR